MEEEMDVPVITSYSIHYTKLYDEEGEGAEDEGEGDAGQEHGRDRETGAPPGEQVWEVP